MRKLSLLIAIAAIVAFAVPAAAFAAQGYTTADVNMRAGPSTDYPIVTTIPERAEVEIYGCLDDRDWCDVSWTGYRGWVSANYLEYFYEGHYVYLPENFEVIHVPIVTFVLGSYWEQHYRGRPWFRNRTHWERYWQTHPRPPVRPRPGARVPRPAPPAPAVRPPEPRTPPATRPERRTPSVRPPDRRAPVTAPPERRPPPSIRAPERRVPPSVGVPERRAPPTVQPRPRVPSPQTGTPQRLQAPGRTVSPPPAASRPGGAVIQRPAPRTGAGGGGQPQQRRKDQQQ